MYMQCRDIPIGKHLKKNCKSFSTFRELFHVHFAYNKHVKFITFDQSYHAQKLYPMFMLECASSYVLCLEFPCINLRLEWHAI